MAEGQQGGEAGGDAQAGSDAGQDAAERALQAVKKGKEAAKTAGKLAASGGTDLKSWLKFAKKYGLPVVGFIMALVLIIAFAFFMLIASVFSGSTAAANSCPSGVTDLAVLATNGPVNVGDKFTNPRDGGLTTITAEMMGNAQAIVRAALDFTINGQPAPRSERAMVVAIGVSLMEAGLINNPRGHATSVGLFQQLALHGTYEQRHNPAWSSKHFYEMLYGVKGWESMTLGLAADKTQRPLHRSEALYEGYMPTAAGLVTSILAAFKAQNPAQQVSLDSSNGGSPIALAASSSLSMKLSDFFSGSRKAEDPVTTAAPAAVTSVYILGDSITFEAKTKYISAFSGVTITPTISAVNSRSWNSAGNTGAGSTGTTGSGKAVVTADAATIKASGAIVIALGTNGGVSSNPVEEIIAAIKATGSTAPIYWVNIASTKANISPLVVPFNNKLLEQQALGAIKIIDWAKTVDPTGDGTKDPSGLLADGVHPNESGKDKLTALVATNVSTGTGGASDNCADLASGELGPLTDEGTAVAKNGQVINLAKVEGITVNSIIASQLQALLAAAKADGITLSGWGFRSYESQVALRSKNHCANIYTAPASTCRPPTAVPGRSQHELGLAIDFTQGGSTLTKSSSGFTWMKNNAGRFGLYNLPSEPWHWSTTGN